MSIFSPNMQVELVQWQVKSYKKIVWTRYTLFGIWISPQTDGENSYRVEPVGVDFFLRKIELSRFNTNFEARQNTVKLSFFAQHPLKNTRITPFLGKHRVESDQKCSRLTWSLPQPPSTSDRDHHHHHIVEGVLVYESDHLQQRKYDGTNKSTRLGNHRKAGQFTLIRELARN